MTHILAGLLVAEAVVEVRRARGSLSPAFVRAAYWVSALANNLPDFDFLYSGLTGGKLGYLIHHRGHTHTVAFVPICVALLMSGVAVWSRSRHHAFDRRDFNWFLTLATLGPILHLLLDATNNYGVHPFWPWDARWFYGDGVFIIEPYLLFCGSAGLVFSATRRLSKALLWLVIGATLGAMWLTGFVPAFAASIATSFLLVLLVVARSLGRLGRARLCLSAWALITATFLLAGSQSRTIVEAEMSHRAPDATLLDAVLTPLPGTPFCWAAMTLALEKEEYVATRSVIALWPEVLGTSECTPRISSGSTAPVHRLARGTHPMLALLEQFRAPRSDLARSFRQSCHASAFLRFARAPFWTDAVLGDLRFDREAGLGFAEIGMARGPCPDFVPNWSPPRADML